MSTEQEVIALVAKRTGRPEISITPEKTFYQLGIDSDDAVELIDELCRRYQVPAEKVDLNKYIGRVAQVRKRPTEAGAPCLVFETWVLGQ